MKDGPLIELTALAQARAIAAGETTAAEIFEAQRAAIVGRNPGINAFAQVFDAPRASEHGPTTTDARTTTTAAMASPLAGACFAVKDNIDVSGVPSHAGLRALQAAPANHSAPAVARLEAAGMQCIGKLNMHAVALGATNHNADFGHAFNPLRSGYTPGGSSGGSGAAVAAHLCAVALGTDTMGSVRVPAAYCGVVGFKPSYDEIPLDGVMPLCRLLDHVGILARSVQDVTAAFRFLSESGRQPHIAEPVERLSPDNSVLAIPAQPDALTMTPEVRRAYIGALERLRNKGMTLVEIDLSGYDFSRVRRAGLLLCEAQLLVTLAPVLASRAGELPADLRAMLDFAAAKKPADIARALDTVVAAGYWMRSMLRPFDALLLPTTGQTAFPMIGPVPHDQADFTAMANVAGVPALSLPLLHGPDELPVGFQLIGRRDQDLPLLQLGEAIQALLGAQTPSMR